MMSTQGRGRAGRRPKLAAILTAALALAPIGAPAQQAGGTAAAGNDDQRRPAAGPLAGRALDGTAIPPEQLAVGALVLLGGAVIVLLGSSDANNNTNGVTTPAPK